MDPGAPHIGLGLEGLAVVDSGLEVEGSSCLRVLLAAKDLPAGLSDRVWELPKPVPVVRLLQVSSFELLEQPNLQLGLDNGKSLKLSLCL